MEIQHIEYEKLIAFVADELNPNEARVVAMHIATCAKCAQTVDHFQSIRRWMRADNSVEPPLAVTERAYAIFPRAAAAPQHVPDSVLVGYATDSLEPVYAQSLATHINSCAECSGTVAHFRSIRLWYRQDKSEEPASAALSRAYAILPNYRRRAMPWWDQVFSFITSPYVRRFALATALVVFVLSGILVFMTVGNLVTTANAALPGDSLYPVKQQVEQVELAATLDTAGKLDKHIAYAGYRVEETAALVSAQRRNEIPSTLAAFESETNLVTQTYNDLAKEDVSRAQTFGTKTQDALSSYSSQLENLRGGADQQVKPLLDHAIGTADSNQKMVGSVFNQLPLQPKPAFATTLTPTGVARPATRVAPGVTSVPLSDATTTPELPLRNTPETAPTILPVMIETATPLVDVPTATRTATPFLPTTTRTATLMPTATRTATIFAPTATQTQPIAPVATSTAPIVVPTATQTPPVIAPTATQTVPVLMPTATQTQPVLMPTATQTPVIMPTATATMSTAP